MRLHVIGIAWVEYVTLCGFGGYQKDSACESSVMFTLDIFWFFKFIIIINQSLSVTLLFL